MTPPPNVHPSCTKVYKLTKGTSQKLVPTKLHIIYNQQSAGTSAQVGASLGRLS